MKRSDCPSDYQVARAFGFEGFSQLYLTVLAGAYEYHDVSLASDNTFDLLSRRTMMPAALDFSADSGMWVTAAVQRFGNPGELLEIISGSVAVFQGTRFKDFQPNEVLAVAREVLKSRTLKSRTYDQCD